MELGLVLCLFSLKGNPVDISGCNGKNFANASVYQTLQLHFWSQVPIAADSVDSDNFM